MIIQTIGPAHASLRQKVKRSYPGEFIVEVRKRRPKPDLKQEQRQPPSNERQQKMDIRV